MTDSLLPLIAVGVSLAAVPLILLFRKWPNLRESVTMAAAFIKFGLVMSLLPGALKGEIFQAPSFEILPGIPLLLRADPFGVTFAMIASSLWIVTSVYSMGYMRGNHEVAQTRYYCSFAVCVGATLGIAFSGNLITFLIFYELLTLATYPLVVHKENAAAIAAGRKYLAYTLTAGVMLIAAVVMTYDATGSIEFRPGGLFENANVSTPKMITIFLLFLGGVGVKAGIMPMHSWLPRAMAAPTPVSALLHAVAVVKSGVFGVIRVVGFVIGTGAMARFGLDTILMVVASFTIVVSSLLAFNQDNLKRRLAYSTIGHLSYIVLGASLLSHLGLMGSVMHMAAHATMKITLFFCAGAIYVNLHRENISDLNGIARVMPWTMAAFTIGCLGLAGVPPINGFYSKVTLASGSLEAGHVVPLVILVLSGVLNIGYFFPILYRAYFRKGENLEGHGEASPLMVVPLMITALLSLILGIVPNLFFHFVTLARQIATSLMGVD